MNILLILVLLVVCINIISIICAIYGWIKKKLELYVSALLICIITISILGGFATECNSIKQIEAYRGNTLLQITYQGSIPIDSVVVYKNK